jgi:hypothetical protein
MKLSVINFEPFRARINLKSTLFHMNFSCLQESTSLPQIAIKQVTNTLILKGINGNVLECYVRRVI